MTDFSGHNLDSEGSHPENTASQQSSQTLANAPVTPPVVTDSSNGPKPEEGQHTVSGT